VVLNRGYQLRWLLSPATTIGMAEGIELRPEARVLPARTIAELHLFLDQQRVWHDARTHTLCYRGDRLVAEYSGPIAHDQTRTFTFEPITPSTDVDDLGDGPSAILCAAQLADVLYRRLASMPADSSQVTARDRSLAKQGMRWAVEVEKLIDPATDLIPRPAIRSVFGSRLLRETPEISTGSWIRAARARFTALATD
jgi:hypothetical protein